MKKMIALLMVLCLLGTAAAAEETGGIPDGLRETIISQLTEVYGYTGKEADDFVMQASLVDGSWQVTYWPPEHDTWIYYSRVTAGEDNSYMLQASSTPFGGDNTNYPGEGSIRLVLNIAQTKDWFSAWDKAACDALQETMKQWNISRTAAFSLVDLTAADAVHAFFESCYGASNQWTTPTQEWRDEVIKQNNLTLSTEDSAWSTSSMTPVSGISTYTLPYYSSGLDMTITDFAEEMPEDIAAALDVPQLAEWRCIGGSTMCYPRHADSNDFSTDGIVMMEKDGTRQLLSIAKQRQSEPWQLYPAGSTAVRNDCEVVVRFREKDSGRNGGYFCIQYLLPNGDVEKWDVLPALNTLSDETVIGLTRLMRYERDDAAAKEHIMLDNNNADGSWFHITTVQAGGTTTEETVTTNFCGYMDFLDAVTMPTSAEACRSYVGVTLSRTQGVCAGVHLRKNPSSHSKDLGEFNPGTIVEVLETVPGTSASWAHVRIGLLEGYMSAVYVDYQGSECSMRPINHTPLYAGKARTATDLRSGTSLFDSALSTLPEGTKFHVLSLIGDWLYVCIPTSGEPGWLMDTSGTYGFVKATDVVCAATSLQLDWLD